MEVRSHKLYYYTAHGVLTAWNSLKAAFTQVENSNFALISRYNVVNLAHVNKYDPVSGDIMCTTPYCTCRALPAERFRINSSNSMRGMHEFRRRLFILSFPIETLIAVLVVSSHSLLKAGWRPKLLATVLFASIVCAYFAVSIIGGALVVSFEQLNSLVFPCDAYCT